MPGPGFRGGWGHHGGGGRGWGPRAGFGPRNPLAGLVAGVATGAVVAAAFAPPPRRRRPPAGHIYVVHAGAPVRTVRVEEAPFIIARASLPTYSHGEGGEVLYHIEVTMNDSYKYTIAKRYSQFDEFRLRVTPIIRSVTPPFPPKHTIWRLSAAGIEERRSMLQAWLQSLITAASLGSRALHLPIYDFLETTLYYPPEVPDTVSQSSAAAGTTTRALPASPAASEAMPVATATPYADTVPGVSANTQVDDDWAVPLFSREVSDTKLAMAGPDKDGKLSAAVAADSLRSGTGAQTEDLRTIWELSDIDKDGKLDRDEFALAWYLAQKAAGGEKPPVALPSGLVPPSKRQQAPTSAANPF